MPSWQRLWSGLRRRAGPLLILYTLARVLLNPGPNGESLSAIAQQLPAYLLLLYIPNLIGFFYITVRHPGPPLNSALLGALLGGGFLIGFGRLWFSQPELAALLFWLPVAALYWTMRWPLPHPWPLLLWPLPLLGLPFGPLATAGMALALSLGLAWAIGRPWVEPLWRHLSVSLWFHGAASLTFLSSQLFDRGLQSLAHLYGLFTLGNLLWLLLVQLRELSEAALPVAATAEAAALVPTDGLPCAALSDHLNDALLVIDNTLTICEANGAARELFCIEGLPSRLFAALKAVNFHDSTGRPLAVGAFPAVQALKGQRIERFTVAQAQGTVTRWYEISAFPLQQGPEPRKVLVICHEVTQERQLEKALARRATELEMIFQEVPVGIALYDGSGQLLRANRLASLFAEMGVRCQQAPSLALALRGQPVTKEEYRLQPRGAAERFVHVTALPLAYSSGQVEGVLMLYEEITLFKQLEKAKNEFLSLVAHELRNPLATLTAASELGKRLLSRHPEAMGPELHRLAPLLTAISEQGHYLGELLSEMLDAAQLGAGRLTVAPEPTDLVTLCAEAVRTRQAVTDKHQLLFVGQPEGPLVAEVDPKRFRQVIDNLIDNAIKYSPAGGPVYVSLAEQGQEIVLEVEDEGCGIAAADLPHLFEGFYRGRQPEATQQASGLGLGLPVSRDLVRLHGGELTIESELGVGTRVTVTLPRSGEAAQPDQPAAAPPPAGAPPNTGG